MALENSQEQQRLDKWLWAARFYKTRTLANEAIQGGKIHINGQRCKPSKSVYSGMLVRIRKDHTEYTVLIKNVCKTRRPASEAQLLYEETQESIQKREHEKSLRKMSQSQSYKPSGRPSKRDRRELTKIKQNIG